MSNYTTEKIGCGALTLLILSGIALIGLMIGAIVQKKDVLVKETPDYLYYKEYTIYNLDSTIYKYHKPITYNGIITKKYKSSRFVGVPGKGGHRVTNYHLVVSYNNKSYEATTSGIYNSFQLNEDVKVVETFYPEFRVEIIKK